MHVHVRSHAADGNSLDSLSQMLGYNLIVRVSSGIIEFASASNSTVIVRTVIQLT